MGLSDSTENNSDTELHVDGARLVGCWTTAVSPRVIYGPSGGT